MQPLPNHTRARAFSRVETETGSSACFFFYDHRFFFIPLSYTRISTFSKCPPAHVVTAAAGSHRHIDTRQLANNCYCAGWFNFLEAKAGTYSHLVTRRIY